MKKLTKILLIGSQHGHELFGDYLWDYIRLNRSELLKYLEFTIANPDAKTGGVRMIESDMNRSFNGKKSTYEEKLASSLLEKLNNNKYDFVLDLHTTTTICEPTIITANFKHTWSFIKSSNIKRVVKMPRKISNTSLIGNFVNSISIEVNEKDAKQINILDSICDDIERFIKRAIIAKEREFFIVESYLKQGDDFLDNMNGLIPFLIGEKSYKESNYIGFMAKSINPPYRRIKKYSS